MRNGGALWSLGLLLLAHGCGGAPPPTSSPTTSEPSDTPPASEPTAPATAESAQPESSAEAVADTESAATQSPEASESNAPTVAEACEEFCVRVEKVCGKKPGRTCRRRCNRYVRTSVGCEDYVRKALACQVEAKETELCSPVASKQCLDEFRAIRDCERGEVPQAQTPESPSAPPGWQRISDDTLAISVLMPPGAELDPDAPRRTWRAEEGGVTYYVAHLDAPPANLSQQALIRMVIKYVGASCQRKLRLHGRYENEGRTTIEYDSACPDRSEWHGMLRIWDGKAVSVGYHGPAGVKGVREPYFYSIRHGPH